MCQEIINVQIIIIACSAAFPVYTFFLSAISFFSSKCEEMNLVGDKQIPFKGNYCNFLRLEHRALENSDSLATSFSLSIKPACKAWVVEVISCSCSFEVEYVKGMFLVKTRMKNTLSCCNT